MSIQRYTAWCRATHGHEPAKDENGEFVLYSDHLSHTQALQGQVEELRKHLEIMTRGVQGEHRIPTMKEVEAARSILAAHRGETK